MANNTLLPVTDEFLHRFGPFPKHPHLAVAVSGGADSMALTLLADQWAKLQGGHITALTVDHGLRPESRDEAEQVARWMKERNIDHYILTPTRNPHSNNLQESARTWRYDALVEWCHIYNVAHCLVAHHAGDQRETVALMTERGDTADGATGMPAVRNYRGIRFLRPLLTVEKEDLKKFLHTHAMGWVEDPSNQNPEFARVRVRQRLQGDAIMRNHLTHQAQEAARDRNMRDQSLAHAAAQCVMLHPLGFADLDYAQWKKREAPFGSQLLADLLTTISGEIRRPRRHETLRLCDALHSGEFKRATLHGCDICLDKGIIRIAREEARCAPPITLSGEGVAEWDNRFRIHYSLPEPLILRAIGKNPHVVPTASPSLWHLDELHYVPHIMGNPPEGASVEIGFAPPKPLAAAPFWWLN